MVVMLYVVMLYVVMLYVVMCYVVFVCIALGSERNKEWQHSDPRAT